MRWDLLAGFDEGRLDRPSQAGAPDRFGLGRAINPERVRWDLPAGFDEAGARSGFSADPDWALAIAVRNKERAFGSSTPMWRHKPPARRFQALAEDLARRELEHAAFLREERRRAFRRERPTPLQISADTHSLEEGERRVGTRGRISALEPASPHRLLARSLPKGTRRSQSAPKTSWWWPRPNVLPKRRCAVLPWLARRTAVRDPRRLCRPSRLTQSLTTRTARCTTALSGSLVCPALVETDTAQLHQYQRSSFK